jgi:hypothetical protein
LREDNHPLHYSNRYHPYYFDDENSKTLRRVYELAVTAIEAGKLKTARIGTWRPFKDILHTKVEPRHFIAWAKSKGLFIPEHLEKFSEKEEPTNQEEPPPDLGPDE